MFDCCRYACLVAESESKSDSQQETAQGLVGVVDVTVQQDRDVLSHLEGAEEYIYVSGIAVLQKFRYFLSHFPAVIFYRKQK